MRSTYKYAKGKSIWRVRKMRKSSWKRSREQLLSNLEYVRHIPISWELHTSMNAR